ncbi:MAG: hypothetical protein GF347_00980 [Candidatus Moranbacteria bacterium]|nr:hypothetical protein [Candidatus Moranbacteria bacterium]
MSPIIEKLVQERKINFKTLAVKPAPNAWVPKDPRFEYDLLLKSMEKGGTDRDYAVQVCKQIAFDYQHVIAEFIEEYGCDKLENLLEDGRKWTLKVLKKWGKTLVESNQINIDINDLVKIEKELREIIKQKGSNFFGYFEGNIIGDHIFIEKETKDVYLAGMRIVPRIGKGYYDFLRSLDWMFLKTPSNQEQFNQIVEYMKGYCNEHNFDWEEMKLVAATRFIGIGWDMLDASRGDLGAGDKMEKLKYLEKFIKRDY